MKTIYLFERGINGWQGIFGAWKNWPNQAIAWVHNKIDGSRAQTLLYFTSAILAGFTRKNRALNFTKMARQYKDWEINIAAHSEGTATVLMALEDLTFPPVNNLHLLCGACDADFNRNGLNKALFDGRVKKVWVYIAEKDWAMKIENTPLGLFLFKIPFKDRSLGLRGPVNADSSVGQIYVRKWPNFGHSDCFTKHNFPLTMMQITGHVT